MPSGPTSRLAGLRGTASEVAASFRVVREVFAVPDLRRVELAYTGFSMTEWASYVAIMVYAFQQGGAAAVGLVSAIQLIPAALFAPFAAVLGDRFRREVMLRIAYLVQVVTTGATAAVLLLDSPVPVVYALSALTAVGITLVRPVHTPLLPALAQSPQQVTAAYVADGMIEAASAMLGPAFAAAIMAFAGPGAVYAGLSAWLVVSLVFALLVRTRTKPAAPSSEGEHVLREALEGFAVLRRDRRPRLVVGIAGAGLITLGLVEVLAVILAFEVFGSGESGAGFLNAALGAGAMVGSLAAVRLITRRQMYATMRNSMLLYGIPVALAAAVPVQGFAAVALVASGAGASTMDVATRTMLQRIVPDESQSRVFGVLEGTWMAGEAIGAVLAAVLAASLGTRGALVATGLLLPLLGLATRRRLREADVGARVPAEDLALLHSLPLFTALGPPELERVAAHVFRLELPAGTTVIREGDVGDRFYVIRSGRAAVVKAQQLLSTLGDGEYFGEIALLRDVPRTATVTAETDLDVLVLERIPFLEAVTPHAASVRSADEVIAVRLDAHDRGAGTVPGLTRRPPD